MGEFTDRLERVESKVDQMSAKIDLLLRHLIGPGTIDQSLSILTESAEPQMHEDLENLKLGDEKIIENEISKLETWMNAEVKEPFVEASPEVGPSFVEIETADFEAEFPKGKSSKLSKNNCFRPSAKRCPNRVHRVL